MEQLRRDPLAQFKWTEEEAKWVGGIAALIAALITALILAAINGVCG